MPTPQTWFVYRHAEVMPWGHRTVRLPDRSYLEWFQRAWREAPAGSAAQFEWIEQELGGDVYGLWSVFEARDTHHLPAPRTLPELDRILQEHLYVERSGPILVEDGCLRVATNDDEYELAYFFIEDELLEAQADRLSCAVRDLATPLPTEAAATPSLRPTDFLPRRTPHGSGPGFTWAICIHSVETNWYYRGQDPPAWVLEGVRVPDLPEYLRSTIPEPPDSPQWETQWLALRAAISPEDTTLQPAIERLSTASGGPVFAIWCADDLRLSAEHATAHYDLIRRLESLRPDHDATDTPAGQYSPHLAVGFVCPDIGPMIFFDDLWATANPQLASSFLRWAEWWDPMDPDKSTPFFELTAEKR